MRRTLITLTLTLTVAAGALAACSSSAAKTAAPGTTVAPTTAAPATTTTVAQPPQKVPAQTRYVVDGEKVDLECKGRGNIPVVFLAGGRANGFVWNNLIASLGDDTFTCVFNRPGTIAEDVNQPIGDLTTPNAVAKTLAATLRQAQVGPRVILVGHSSGGAQSIVFGGQYPKLVAGAVLFDPTVPTLIPADEWKRIGYEPAATVAQTAAVTRWPDVPLVILTADAKLVVKNKEATAAEERDWIAGHRRWAGFSSQGEQREVPNTSHAVYLSAPAVSRDTIREVLDAAS